MSLAILLSFPIRFLVDSSETFQVTYDVDGQWAAVRWLLRFWFFLLLVASSFLLYFISRLREAHDSLAAVADIGEDEVASIWVKKDPRSAP